MHSVVVCENLLGVDVKSAQSDDQARFKYCNDCEHPDCYQASFKTHDDPPSWYHLYKNSSMYVSTLCCYFCPRLMIGKTGALQKAA